jgi:hypothetical protein
MQPLVYLLTLPLSQAHRDIYVDYLSMSGRYQCGHLLRREILLPYRFPDPLRSWYPLDCAAVQD